MNGESIATEPVPYQLRIGVTGHIDLTDDQKKRILAAVTRLLDHIERCLTANRRTPIEWVVATMGARGADRIVAEAVEMRPKHQIQLVMPFEPAKYREDFKDDPKDLAEFVALESRSIKPIPVVTRASGFPENREQRDLGYLNAGRAIADTSEILIAIWNGDPAEGVGGTGDVVRYALRAPGLIFWINSKQPEEKPRWLKPVDRAVDADHASVSSHDNPAAPREFDYKTADLPTRDKDISYGYVEHDKFANHRARNDAVYQDLLRQEIDSQRQHTKASGLASTPLIHAIEKEILPYTALAERLAQRWQWMHSRASTFMFVGSAVAVTLAALRPLRFPGSFVPIWLELIVLVSAVLVVIIARGARLHERWLDARYFVEQARTARFAVLVGADFSAADLTRNVAELLPFYAGPKNWVTAFVSHLDDLARASPGVADFDRSAHFAALKDLIVNGWYRKQRDWHHDSAHAKETKAKILRWTIPFMVLAVLFLARLELIEAPHQRAPQLQTVAAHPVTSEAAAHAEGSVLARWHWLITLGTIAIPACVAALHGMSKQFELERLAARSIRMHHLLHRQVELVASSSSYRQLAGFVRRTIRVIATENYEWWVLLSFDPPEIVA